MKLKKWISFALAGAMCLSLAACGDKATQSNLPLESSGNTTVKSVTLTENWDFASGFYPVINHSNSANHGFVYWGRNFYDTLVAYDQEQKIQGALAETWEVSEDGKMYTFHLRKGIKFSDGTPLTADAVKQSFSAAITNLGQANGSFGMLTKLIAQMQAPDENTFVLQLTSPYYGTLNDLTMSTPLGVVNPRAFEGGEEKAYENCKTSTMGTGAYMYEGFDGTTYTFLRNPYYWGVKPELDRFQIKVIEDNDAKVLALRNGEIDLIIGASRISYDGFTDLATDGAFGNAINKAPTLTRYLGMNLTTAPFDDQLIRQAVAYAVDQQALENSVFNGIESAAETLFAREKPYCDVKQTTYATDLEKAKTLMEQAGWTDTDGDGVREKNGKKLEIKISYTKSFSTIDDAVLGIASQLEKIGFKVQTSGSDMMSWFGDIMAGNYTLALYFTYGGAFDPSTVMTNMDPAISADPIVIQFTPMIPGGVELISELNSTPDFERVQAIYAQVLAEISNQCMAVPITYARETAIWNNKLVSSYDFCPDAQYVNVAGIHLK